MLRNASDHVDARNYNEAYLAGSGGTDDWPPIKWKMVWLADTYTLGRHGIRPRFDNQAADDAWLAYRVDPAGQLRVRDYLRVVLAGMVASGESFVNRTRPGFMPLPAPMQINYDDSNIVSSYRYNNPNRVVAAVDMIHSFVIVRPGQTRGDDLFQTIRLVAGEQAGYALSIGKLGKLAARLFLFRKRSGGNRIIGDASDSHTDESAGIDFTQDNIVDIGPNDDIVTPGTSSPPIPPLDMIKFLGTIISQPYGISRMQLLGDFSDTNYSSARFAALTDNGVWERYQDILFDHVRELYQEWPERARYQSSFIGWHLPPFPHVDPQRRAATDNILVAMQAKSVQEVIIEDGRDPEQTFRQIEEYQRRFAQPTAPEPPPPA